MPLNTQILRDGKELKLRWGHFHVACMCAAAALELPASQCKLWADPTQVRQELEDHGYPEEPMPVTPAVSFALVDYGALSLTPLNGGRVTLKKHHKFVDTTDGEILELQPDDVLVAYRN